MTDQQRQQGPRRRNAQGFTTHLQVAEWYDNKYVEMSGGWHTPIEELDAHLDALGLPSDAWGMYMSLVDLGSGDGQLLMRALRRGASCTGIEISKVGRRMTLGRYDKEFPVEKGRPFPFISLYGSPMESTGCPTNWFDYAISLGSMEHALDIPAAVTEMATILKHGGRWLLYVPNEEWVHEDQALETTAPSSWWIGLLTEAGLEIESDEKIRDNNRIVGWKP